MIGEKERIYLTYNGDENCFYGEFGERILNLFALITPNDLFLFRKDPEQFSVFPTVQDKNVLCEICFT